MRSLPTLAQPAGGRGPRMITRGELIIGICQLIWCGTLLIWWGKLREERRHLDERRAYQDAFDRFLTTYRKEPDEPPGP
jgi:hypothetical protein